MPIVIVRGNKPDKQSSELASGSAIGHRAYEEDEETQSSTLRASEHQNQVDLLADMEDVMNLKVYRISKPNFLDNSTTTTLIGGDIFYHQDMIVPPSSANSLSNAESPRKAAAISAAASTNTDDKKNANPTVLQHIRAFKYKSTRKTEMNANKSHFVQQIQENFMRCKLVKAGQPLAKHINKPSIDDALQWAIEFVTIHESSLAGHLIHLDERIKEVDSVDRASLQQSSMQVMPMEKTKGNFAAKFAQTKNGTGQPAMSGMEGPGQSTKTAVKTMSLVQQLENLKNAGTDAFLKSVVIENPPSSASNRKKQSPKNLNSISIPLAGAYSAPSSASSVPLEPSKPNQTKRSNAPVGRGHRTLKVSNQAEGEANPGTLTAIQESFSVEESSPSMPAMNNANNNADNDDMSATSQLEENMEQDSMVNKPKISIDIPPLPTLEGNSSKEAGGPTSKKVTILGTDPSPEIGGNATDLLNEANSGATKRTRSPRGKGKPTKYSNAKIDSANVDNSKITIETQETIEEMKRTKAILAKSLGFTMKIFQKQKQHQEELTRSVAKKLDRANRHGQHLFQEFEYFEDSKHGGNHQVGFLTTGKEVHRLQQVEAKTATLNDPTFASASSNIHRDMKFLKERTKEYVDSKKLATISKFNWFIIALLRLREYVKRMNNNNNALPPCCVKCLVILEQLIGLDFAISKHVFYEILLTTKVFQKDDFRKNIVHQVIDAIREGLDIAAEEFVKFLEEHDFQVPPELMNQVRNNSTRNSSARDRTTTGVHATSTSTKAVVFASNLENRITLPPIESYPFDIEMSVVEPETRPSSGLADVVMSALFSTGPADTTEDLAKTRQGVLSTSDAVDDEFDLEVL